MASENGIKMDGRDPNTGRFVRGWKGGRRPKGSKNKVITANQVVFAHALSCDPNVPENRTRLETALDRMVSERPAEYLRLVARLAGLW